METRYVTHTQGSHSLDWRAKEGRGEEARRGEGRGGEGVGEKFSCERPGFFPLVCHPCLLKKKI